jgi:hypothetical protein
VDDPWKALKQFVLELQLEELDNANTHSAQLMGRIRSKMELLEEVRLARYQSNGSDAEHAETYRLSVELAAAWLGQPNGLHELRRLYAQSRRIERDGAPRQATHRRGLVHALAASLSVTASQAADADITVSPQEARTVLDSVESGLRRDPDAAVDAALARYRGHVRGDSTDDEGTDL